MTLVDTSAWIDHLRAADARLSELLDENQVLVHPFVLGELACGTLRRRSEILGHLRQLPQASLARDEEVHHLLEAHRLEGKGLGWIDLHLLASARLHGVDLLTHDQRLRRATAAVLTSLTRPTSVSRLEGS